MGGGAPGSPAPARKAAGVATARGRGWYGVRRVITDEAPNFTANVMVLERVSGTSSRMLEETYRDAESEKVKLEASRIVGALRGAGCHSGASVAAAPSVLALDPALIEALEGRTVGEVRAALEFLNSHRAAEPGNILEPLLEPSKNRPIPGAESGGVSASKSTS